jgi:hypothetical protein
MGCGRRRCVPNAGRDIERKGTRGGFQIKDTGGFDKDNLPRHAPRAHLLRRPPACYSFAIWIWTSPQPSSGGELRRGRKGLE